MAHIRSGNRKGSRKQHQQGNHDQRQISLVRHPAGSRVPAETDLPIMFGDLTASIVLMLAAAYGLVVAARKTWLTAGFLLCLLFGLVAVILSGTRGAWVALLLLLPLLFGLLGRVTHKRYLALIVVSLLVLFAGTFAVSRTDVRHRLAEITEQISFYQTALRSLSSNRTQNVRDVPFCNDQRQFLQGWLSLSGRGGTLAVEVTKDTMLTLKKQLGVVCHDGYALHIAAPTNSGGGYLRRIRERLIIPVR